MVLVRIAGPDTATLPRGNLKASRRVTHTRSADRTPLTHPLASVTVINPLAIRDGAFDAALMLTRGDGRRGDDARRESWIPLPSSSRVAG
jgi:hypothetical protein